MYVVNLLYSYGFNELFLCLNLFHCRLFIRFLGGATKAIHTNWRLTHVQVYKFILQLSYKKPQAARISLLKAS